MDAISYTAARANLAQTMKRVCADHEPLIITRNGAGQRTACQLGGAQSRFCHASSGRQILTYQVEFLRSAAKTHIRLD